MRNPAPRLHTFRLAPERCRQCHGAASLSGPQSVDRERLRRRQRPHQRLRLIALVIMVSAYSCAAATNCANSSALPCQSTTSPFSGRSGRSRTRTRLAIGQDPGDADNVFAPDVIIVGQQHHVGILQKRRVFGPPLLCSTGIARRREAESRECDRPSSRPRQCRLFDRQRAPAAAPATGKAEPAPAVEDFPLPCAGRVLAKFGLGRIYPVFARAHAHEFAGTETPQPAAVSLPRRTPLRESLYRACRRR